MTDGELRQLIGHCGSIKKLRIFNRRPELDPSSPLFDKVAREGLDLETAKREQKHFTYWLKKQRSMITPVYAIVEFEDDQRNSSQGEGEGGGALRPSYRLFGLVVRKHAITTVAIASGVTNNNFHNNFESNTEDIEQQQHHPGLNLNNLWLEAMPETVRNLDFEGVLNKVLSPEMTCVLEIDEHDSGTARNCKVSE